MAENNPPAKGVKSSGVWIAYTWDNGPHQLAAFSTEIEALRYALDNYGSCTWLPWGIPVEKAIHRGAI